MMTGARVEGPPFLADRVSAGLVGAAFTSAGARAGVEGSPGADGCAGARAWGAAEAADSWAGAPGAGAEAAWAYEDALGDIDALEPPHPVWTTTSARTKGKGRRARRRRERGGSVMGSLEETGASDGPYSLAPARPA